jgi:hypothetical protein
VHTHARFPKKGDIMKTTIEFKLHQETELPQDFIDSVPRSGRADEAVKYIQYDYNVECDKEDLIKFLKSYGAWESSELQDHNDNIDRLIWLACLDCQENETTYFYMGE